MLSAARSLRQAATTDPLPQLDALRALNQDGVVVRRGELVMITAIPNAGKSLFVLWWIASLNLRTLCFSADNSVHTTLTRLLSWKTGIPRRDIEADLDDEETGQVLEQHYMDQLKDSNIEFCFDGSLTMDQITQELSAYVELYDEWPEVIVIDNLINVEGTGDHQGQNGILSELHWLARMSGATVFVLHHMSQAQEKPGKSPDPTMPRGSNFVQNKVTHYPDLVLSVAADSQQGLFRIAAVKVRGEKNDPSAIDPYLLWVDFPTCTFYADNPRWTPHDVLYGQEEYV